VVCHGTPFYAGWGLTRDLAPVPDRRGRALSLDALVAGVLILYPRYLDPVTGLPCPPEVLVDRMASARATNRLRWIAPCAASRGASWQPCDDLENAMTQIILDVSRLISRMHYDAVGRRSREMAYVRGLLARFGDGLDFAAVHPTGLYGRLRRDAILPYFDELERRWSREETAPNGARSYRTCPCCSSCCPIRRGGKACGLYPGFAAPPGQDRQDPPHPGAGERAVRLPGARSHPHGISRICPARWRGTAPAAHRDGHQPG
jgi:hypothetical protein